jgi:hypothetical protein
MLAAGRAAGPVTQITFLWKLVAIIISVNWLLEIRMER